MKSFPSEKSRTLLESSFFNLSSGCLAFAASLTGINGQDGLFLDHFALEAQLFTNNALLRIHCHFMFVSEDLNGLLLIPHYAAATCLIVAKVHFPTFWPLLWTIFKSFPFLISFFFLYSKNNPLRYACRFATTLLWPLHIHPERAQIYQFRPGAPPSREATSLPDQLVSRKRTAFSYCTPCFPRGTEGKVRKVI
jgi:hypothetical protein